MNVSEKKKSKYDLTTLPLHSFRALYDSVVLKQQKLE